MKTRRFSRDRVELELTPLIDVLFMLLVFFVLTATFMNGQIPVDLPSGHGAKPPGDPLILSIDAEGKCLVQGKEVSPDEAVDMAGKAASEGRPVIIAGDRSASYGGITMFLDRFRSAGVENVGLLVEDGESP